MTIFSRIRSASEGESSKAPASSTGTTLKASSSDKSQETASTPKDPQTAQQGRMSLRNLVTILIKMRQARQRASSRLAIHESSGDPQTHPAVRRAVDDEQLLNAQRIELTDSYRVIGGVNLPLLLRKTRASMLLQGDALAEEKWDVDIVPKKKTRAGHAYKVSVSYSAARIPSASFDPHLPVALDAARGIPGLMTIVSRA